LRFAVLVDDHVGHAHALIGVGRRLHAAGHDVAFFGPGGMAGRVAQAGFSYRAEAFLSPAIGPPCAEGGSASPSERRATLKARAAGVVEAARRLVAAHAPDLVIFDPFLLCHYPAFARLGTRAVAVSTKPLLTQDAWVPPYTSGLVPSGSARSLRVAAAWGRQRLAYAVYRGRCVAAESLRGWSHRSLTVAVARAAGFPLRQEWATRPLRWDLRFASVPELVLHAREFELPRRRRLRGPGAFVGPCVDLPEAPGPLERPPGDGPLLYCHLGSVARQRGARALAGYRAVLAALRAEPSWRAVIATGDSASRERLADEAQTLADRVVLREWLPRGAGLAGADVAITHGGANSVKEAILAGRPLLVLPRGVDQPGVAARVAYHGLGLVARGTARAVHAQLVRLLNEPEFGVRVRAMQDCFLRYDRERVCERILAAAAQGRVPHFDDAP
jgi:zeaxanthin glucosyltransferase